MVTARFLHISSGEPRYRVGREARVLRVSLRPMSAGACAALLLPDAYATPADQELY
jgi:hypothetical protein